MPSEIGGLVLLQCLWADENKLRSLPEEFGELTSLTELSLDNNILFELCDSFSRLTNLKELFLHDNSLGLTQMSEFGEVLHAAGGVPETVCMLPNLEALSLAGNSLTEKLLPERIKELTSLTELWLQKNNFDQLPRQVCDLPRLRYVLIDPNIDTAETTSDFFSQVCWVVCVTLFYWSLRKCCLRYRAVHLLCIINTTPPIKKMPTAWMSANVSLRCRDCSSLAAMLCQHIGDSMFMTQVAFPAEGSEQVSALSSPVPWSLSLEPS